MEIAIRFDETTRSQGIANKNTGLIILLIISWAPHTLLGTEDTEGNNMDTIPVSEQSNINIIIPVPLPALYQEYSTLADVVTTWGI